MSQDPEMIETKGRQSSNLETGFETKISHENSNLTKFQIHKWPYFSFFPSRLLNLDQSRCPDV